MAGRVWREQVKVAQSCLTPCSPVDCNLPGSSVHEIPQGRILDWVAFSFSRGSSLPRDQTHVSQIAGGFFTIWATRVLRWTFHIVSWGTSTSTVSAFLSSVYQDLGIWMIQNWNPQTWYYSQFGTAHSFLGGPVLCIVRCLAASSSSAP